MAAVLAGILGWERESAPKLRVIFVAKEGDRVRGLTTAAMARFDRDT